MKEEKKSVEEILNDVKKNTPEKERDPLHFVLGVIFLAIGTFILSRKIQVHSGFFGYSLWGFNIGFGLVVLPLLFGIAWMFYNPKSIWGKIISALGALFILVSVIMNTSIHLVAMTLYDYILIIGMIAVGFGLLFRYYFKRKEK